MAPRPEPQARERLVAIDAPEINKNVKKQELNITNLKKDVADINDKIQEIDVGCVTYYFISSPPSTL